MEQVQKDIQAMQSILPSHYKVNESKRKGSIHCKSKVGLRENIDADDEEHWGYVLKAIKSRFAERFIEISHNVNFCYTDFTVFLRP